MHLFLYPWIAVIHCCLSKHNFLECLKVGQSAKSSKSSHVAVADPAALTPD